LRKYYLTRCLGVYCLQGRLQIGSFFVELCARMIFH